MGEDVFFNSFRFNLYRPPAMRMLPAHDFWQGPDARAKIVLSGFAA
jgi:hypothetical protein